MSYFHDWFELVAYGQRMINLGVGHTRPMLDRRGCDCSQGPVPIGDPGDGERLSADGSMGFISCRRMPE